MPDRPMPDLIEPTEEEDRAITAAALADPDNPPLSEEQLARMSARMTERRRGAQKVPT